MSNGLVLYAPSSLVLFAWGGSRREGQQSKESYKLSKDDLAKFVPTDLVHLAAPATDVHTFRAPLPAEIGELLGVPLRPERRAQVWQRRNTYDCDEEKHNWISKSHSCRRQARRAEEIRIGVLCREKMVQEDSRVLLNSHALMPHHVSSLIAQ